LIPLLQVNDLRCRYGDTLAVDGATFSLEEGELACLLGPSGCGKTTVLRAIAGFQKLETGTIVMDGKTISNTQGNVAPEHRNVGMVFQDHALFPHLTVARNVAAGVLSRPAVERDRIVDLTVERVGLSGLRNRYPHELSGGQQQRVALARALAPGPRLLLMDEPYSSLDVELREKLGQEVRDLLKDTRTTCILVTHDQQDAFTFGEVVGVMRRGAIEQWDGPYNLYHQPATPFVADFIGDGVLLKGIVIDGKHVKTELAILRGHVPHEHPANAPVRVLVRPDDIVHDDDSPLTARIKKKAFRGESYLYTLELPSGQEVLSLVHSHHNHDVGAPLGIKMEVKHLVVFPAAERTQ